MGASSVGYLRVGGALCIPIQNRKAAMLGGDGSPPCGLSRVLAYIRIATRYGSSGKAARGTTVHVLAPSQQSRRTERASYTHETSEEARSIYQARI